MYVDNKVVQDKRDISSPRHWKTVLTGARSKLRKTTALVTMEILQSSEKPHGSRRNHHRFAEAADTLQDEYSVEGAIFEDFLTTLVESAIGRFESYSLETDSITIDVEEFCKSSLDSIFENLNRNGAEGHINEVKRSKFYQALDGTNFNGMLQNAHETVSHSAGTLSKLTRDGHSPEHHLHLQLVDKILYSLKTLLSSPDPQSLFTSLKSSLGDLTTAGSGISASSGEMVVAAVAAGALVAATAFALVLGLRSDVPDI